MHTDIDMGGSSMGRGGFSHCASPWREARVRMERKIGGGGALIPFNSPLFVKPQHKNGMLMFLKHI